MASSKNGVELPEEIIQHIQSFMEIKLSAQTLLLSKSWYKAWSTRPNLHFDASYFYVDPDTYFERFWDSAINTVQRYIYLNLKVDKFQLSMYDAYAFQNSYRVEKLIFDALKLRMNVLQLDFRKGHTYSLPAQVFANKYLTELYLCNCKIDYLDTGNVLCSNLKSVELSSVSIKDDNTFTNLLVRCPLIQYLKFSSFIKGLTGINTSELLNLETLIVEYSAFGSSAMPITSSFICGQFLKLSRLVLNSVDVDDSFFTNISSRFPKLEDLTLEQWHGNPTFQITSRSITSLSLKHNGIVKMVELDVPNIRNFKFSGNHIPPLSFTHCSKECTSEISLERNSCGTIDLSKLREFLIKLGQSKITLHLLIGQSRNVVLERNIENFHLPAIEELIFGVEYCEEYNFFVKCILGCRPKVVSLHFCLDYQCGDLKTISIQFMYKKLIEQRNQNGCSTTTQNSELEEVNVELFDESLKLWQPVKSNSDDMEFPNHGADKLRFKLKWRSLTPEYTVIKLIEYYHSEDSYY